MGSPQHTDYQQCAGIRAMSKCTEERAVIRATKANLAASRMAPDQLKATINALESIRDDSKSDARSRKMASEVLIKLYIWQTDREDPVDQRVKHEHSGSVTSINIKVHDAPQNSNIVADSSKQNSQVVDIQGQGKGSTNRLTNKEVK